MGKNIKPGVRGGCPTFRSMIITTLILMALVLLTAWDNAEVQVAPVREPTPEKRNSHEARS